MNFLADTELQEQRMNDRSLLIGGGSEPRLTLKLSGVQFLKNRFAVRNYWYYSLATNGLFDIATAFADVTLSDCLFKDNQYLYTNRFVSFV